MATELAVEVVTEPEPHLCKKDRQHGTQDCGAGDRLPKMKHDYCVVRTHKSDLTSINMLHMINTRPSLSLNISIMYNFFLVHFDTLPLPKHLKRFLTFDIVKVSVVY